MKPIPKILSLLLGLLVLGISVPFLLYLGLFILLFFDPIVLRGMIPLLAAFLVFLLSLLFKGAAHKKVAKFAGILTLVGLVTTLGSFGYTKYMDSIRVVDNTSIDTEKYLAFHEDSELVRLDHEASLKFTILDDLPVVDGAAALFPMYSSFVNAVYPPNIGELNRTDISPYRYSNTIGAYDSLMYKECDVIFAAGPGEFEKSFFGKMDVEMDGVQEMYRAKNGTGYTGEVSDTAAAA